MKFIIDQKLIDIIVSYLSQKPFFEVYKIIVELQRLTKIENNGSKDNSELSN